MATGIGILDLTFESGADLRTNIYYFVKKDTSGNAVVLAGDGDRALGVLQNKPNSGEAANVRVLGTSPVITGDADVTEGALVASDSGGKADVAASTEFVNGICLDSGDHTTGKIATILLAAAGKI